jgi:UDP-N-acetylglucosamine--N-acetylmuramyl-(pentapeptide) pyrophosphoryl-undecaprenol N-acetylglucosamine transferase
MTATSVSQQPILLMAGGTGGHVFPALAIAEALRAQNIPVAWIGTEKGLEARIVPAAQIPIHYLSIQGVRGKGAFSLVAAPFRIVRAIAQAIKILRQVKPRAVVGMGGFVTGPAGIAAWLLRIPVIVHEQNAIAGLTNRWLARIATQVLEAFPETFPKSYHAVYTGNPLRNSISQIIKNQATKKEVFNILIVGGSLGAKALNDMLPLALHSIEQPIAVWHQTGKNNADSTAEAYHLAKYPVKVVEFIENMAEAYEWADLVICRAGALTVSELAQAGVPSILVPFPHAVDDHQTHNAKYLVAQGAAILIQQRDLNPAKLASAISELLNPSRLAQMAAAAQACATPEALTQVVAMVLKHSLTSNPVEETPP